MGNSKRILVFDSGIGGLSVVAALRAIAPGLAIDYIADNAAFPYGKLQDDVLLDRVCTVLQSALQTASVDGVVIACNTVSTSMLAQLRVRFVQPIFGVVPPIKPAAEYSRNRCIALLATPATLRQRYIDDLIQKYAPDCLVIRIGSSQLAQRAEEQVRGDLRIQDIESIRTILQPVLEEPAVDAIALGCTHYPFLLDVFKTIIPENVRWFDPAPAVARHVLKTIGSYSVSELPDRLFFTADLLPTPRLLDLFAMTGFAALTIMTITFESERA